MKYTVDCHFHPNLPESDILAKKRCAKWWRAIQKEGINTVFITGHAFKDAKRAYLLMKETKPEDIVIFPGIEYITSEGVELLIYSKNELLYDFPEMQPWKMTCDETVTFIQKHNLDAACPHPHTISVTSIIGTMGYDQYRKTVDALRAAEISNTCLDDFCKLLGAVPFSKVWRKKRKQLKDVTRLPKQDYPKNPRFLVAGSDAHHRSDLGTFIVLDVDREKLYDAIMSNKNPEVVIRKKHFSFINFLKDMYVTHKEFNLKIHLKAQLDNEKGEH